MILSLKSFSFEYSPNKTALVVPDLSISAGEKIVLVGQNGSGKSTLLHSLAGVLAARQGTRVCKAAPEKISLVFQSPCLDKKLTVKDNLKIFGKIWGMSNHVLELNLKKIIDMLMLEDLLERDVGTLSGGQQRRADLARALLPEPEVLFLDEPTSGLDVMSRREFWSILAKAKQATPELTLICASHHSAELELFDRILILHNGQISLDRKRSDLMLELPGETLEINTFDAVMLSRILTEKYSLLVTDVMHTRLLIHTRDATDVLTQLRNDLNLSPLIESTTMRKTSLSDVVWQKLIKLASAQYQSSDRETNLARLSK